MRLLCGPNYIDGDSMECPICGLINSPDSLRCDCGYDFNERAGGRRPKIQWHPFWSSLVFAWLIVTFGDLATSFDAGEPHRWNFVPNALFNLFTPILLGNLSKHSALGVTASLLFVGLFIGDLLGRYIKLKSFRLVYNLLFLGALTAAIDMITWGSTISIKRLLLIFSGRPQL